ncbi:MAG: autotransporter domain-containing protein [Desulfomicrobium sp.]|nr:autotransporter domain-containing protein [Pseudomonadota bacterium]MBV1714072.1 autotransporter domain-containing protein [Desulfomicrobium sp.]MBU4571609.1 autotransporter domain-containing protein [Pseudomonadota bacterium]MBU4595757.1 autotransporter domain-containing protein [Pseudomonadota bacterium]MBV1721675.1 autotransporter domain-containing protein [Desulfomicrobium sp.]
MDLSRLMKSASGATRSTCASLFLFFLMFFTQSLHAAELVWLSGTMLGINSDGSVIVGYGDSGSGNEALRWTDATGMVGLGDLPGGIFSSSAYAVSADGSVIVGTGNSASGSEAFRWTDGTGMVGLGDLPGGIFSSEAYAVSADGSVIVGYGNSASGNEAFRWTDATGMVGLGDLPGGTFSSRAYAVSADGSVIVGYGVSESGTEAFRWTDATGMLGLGDLPGGTFSIASAVNADGSVIVGTGNSVSGYEAFRWTAATDMVGLGDLPGGTFSSSAYAVSADGSVIVGTGYSASGYEAFRWTDGKGIQSLSALLVAEGVDLTGWTLNAAYNISADGSTIVGIGTNSDGPGPFIARLYLNSPPGLITPYNLSASLAEMATVGPAAMYLGKANMEGLMDVSRESVIFGTGSEPRSANQFWTTGTLVGGDDLSGEFGGGGGVGLTHHFVNGLSIGGGIFPDMRRFETSHGGDQEIESIGPGIFLGYAPDAYGLRLEAGAMASLINMRLERGYQNGEGSAQSRGKTQGEGYGLYGRLGWAFPVTERIAVQPFIQHSWQHIHFDGYTESDGPFPAKYDAFSDTVNTSRAGIEGQYAFSERLGLRAWVAYSHRHENESPSMSGEVIGLNAFEFSGADLDQDWMDTGMGVTWRPLDGFTTFSRLGLAIDADDTGTPDVTWTLGFQWDL